MVEFNFDWASRGKLGSARGDTVLRDCQGKWIDATAENWDAFKKNIAEARAPLGIAISWEG